MTDNQKTIATEISVSGKGLHTGNETHVTFKPAGEDTGIRFIRTDLPEKPVIPALSRNVVGVIRGTTLGLNSIPYVYTVEHLMAAVYSLGVDNLEILLDNNEPPVFDGSSKPFVDLLLKAGIFLQNKPKEYIKILSPVRYTFNDGKKNVEITALPSETLTIDYTIEYAHPLVGFQQLKICLCPETFENEISRSRTFCFDYEIEALKSRGLAKGGDLNNTIVIGIDKIHNDEKLRYPDEFVRHKLLDFIGDLSLAGKGIKAEITIKYSGHKHNINFVKMLVETSTKEVNLDEIKKVIPHREPFLFLDRVVIMEPGKSAIGYRKITGQEDFFRGHFPGNPIMPGVLIVEGMAQTSCVLVMSHPELSDKTPFFMSIENAKFRKPVLPGDMLEFRIEAVKVRGRSGKIRGEAYVNGKIVAETDFMFMLVDR